MFNLYQVRENLQPGKKQNTGLSILPISVLHEKEDEGK